MLQIQTALMGPKLLNSRADVPAQTNNIDDFLSILNRLQDKPIIVYYIMANQGNTNTPTEPTDVYVESGIIYIRYHATIDTKPNGQMKINGKRPAYTKIEKQPRYT